MRVACTVANHWPICPNHQAPTREHSGRATSASASPPCRLSILLPASFNLVAGLRWEERDTGTSATSATSGTSRWESTSLCHVMCRLPRQCSSPVLQLQYMHALIITYFPLLHYRMHLHIITTSPRKGPTRPAAPREPSPNHTLPCVNRPPAPGSS